MKVVNYDLSRYEAFIHNLEVILHHRRQRPTTRSDELYYELLLEYYRRPLRARAEGKPLIAHAAYIPTEILYAMDLVPFHLESFSVVAPSVLRNFEELASAAKGFGLTPEVCSAHRVQAAWFVNGWLPRPDAVLWSQQMCDSISHSGSLLREVYDLPGYYLDRPYRFEEREVRYYAQNLAEMAEFLEGVTGHKLDLQRLCQALYQSYQSSLLQTQLYRLGSLVPSPVPNRLGDELLSICNWLYLGTAEGVDFAQVALSEVKERAAAGRGVVPQEKHRLLALYPPPSFHWKLMDWLEREHGAMVVARPYCLHWGPWAPDYGHPWESLARRCFATPISRQFHGPIGDCMVPDALWDAADYKAEGAFFFAMINCRQGCAMVRTLKDALMERAGIPTLVLDVDVLDPSFVSEEELKDRFEGFFEVLAERRANAL